MKTKRLTLMALLLSIALIVFVIELRIPPIVPIPGIKLGLANSIILFSLFTMKKSETMMIIVLRVIIGNVYAGSIMSMMYSLSGALVCFVMMCLVSKFVNQEQVWICSICGAIGHNIGQILIAVAVTQTVSIFMYLPVLMLSAIITGLITGLIAQALIGRMTNVLNVSR